MRQRKGPRPARAVALGAATSLLTLAGHALGSGSLPSTVPVLLLAALLTAMAAPLSSAKPRLAVIFAAMLAGQLFGHAVLVLAHPHPGHGSALVPSGAMVAFHAAAAILGGILFLHAEAVAASWSRFVRTLLGTATAIAPLPSTPMLRTLPPSPLRSLQFDLPLLGRAPPVVAG